MLEIEDAALELTPEVLIKICELVKLQLFNPHNKGMCEAFDTCVKQYFRNRTTSSTAIEIVDRHFIPKLEPYAIELGGDVTDAYWWPVRNIEVRIKVIDAYITNLKSKLNVEGNI